MIVFLHLDPQQGKMNVTVDGGDAQTALQMLAAATQMISQQIAAPKVFLPNGQAIAIPPLPPPDTAPTTDTTQP